MIRHRMCGTSEYLRWPRTSGDDPYAAEAYKTAGVLAPHERG